MRRFQLALLALWASIAVFAQNPTVTWDRHSLLFDGRRVAAVMGEIHYSRLPADEWAAEVRKMKEGGVTIIANYVFWNHVEEQQGVFDWSGQRSLRHFLEVCKAEGMPVCLRIGPFCHGEARCGGIPDWVVTSGCKLRSEDPQFLGYVEALYRQIFTQVQGLQWKDGGPVLACQFDNEFGGNGSYLMRLKHIANEVGFDLPFYTRTGWPELRTPVPFGEMLPLYGDYADGFWDRSTRETAGNYYKAFNFRASPVSGAIGSEQLDYSQTLNSTLSAPNSYPYFTCELGGGMMTSYHRRCYLYPEDAYSMAVVKLGSGSNLLGYYMYHGGTNPTSQWRPGDTYMQPYDGDRAVYLNECQRSASTNHNDLPVLTYDFQAPLGEFGQINPHYYLLRKLHLFLQDFGEELAPMEVTFPCTQEIRKGQDDFLRWSFRSVPSPSGSIEGGSAFVFINNYERLQHLSDKHNVRFDVCGVQFPKKALTVPAGTSCIFPVNVAGLRYATAQLIARREGRIYLQQIPGIPTELAFQDGKTLCNVKLQGTSRPVYTTKDGTAYYLIDGTAAGTLFMPTAPLADAEKELAEKAAPLTFRKMQEAGPLRTITLGAKNVAQEPLDRDFDDAAVYTINLPQDSSAYAPQAALLQIYYQGDVARLYADGQLIADNFYNGRPFLYGLWRLPAGVQQLELRILPLQKDMPVYFPREADTTPGERLQRVTISYLHDSL